MKSDSSLTVRRISFTGLMAALTVAASAARITLPLGIGGTTSFHLGNILCALSGLLLGPWFGGLAAGLGSAIFDLTNPAFAADCWLTFLFKGAYGLVAGLVAWSGKKEWGYGKAALGAAAGAITYALLYIGKHYFYTGMIVSGLSAAGALTIVVSKLPATVFNAVLAIVCAPPLALSLRSALRRSRLLP